MIHLFLAENVKMGEAHPDGDEFLNIKKYSVDEALDLIYKGKIKDAKTVIGIMRYALSEEKK